MRIAFYCNDPSCSIDKSSEGTSIIIPTDLNYQHLTDLYRSLSSEQITCDLSFQIIHPTDHPILSLQDQDQSNKEGVGKEFSIPSSTLSLEEVVKESLYLFQSSFNNPRINNSYQGRREEGIQNRKTKLIF